MTIKRIGFACKWAELDSKQQITNVPELTTGGTTLAWAKRNKREVAEQKVIDVATRNINNTHNLVKRVASLEPELRMVRLTSDMLSFYTEPSWKDFWKTADVQNYLAKLFAPIGETARKHNVRLSFHPDQFVVLASDRPEVVTKSIEEFEYHADMARWMGYGEKFQDFKINVHISGRKGPQGIKDVLGHLSTTARNCLTIENDEMCWGIEDSLELEKHCALVLDIHHHWVRTGEYIQATDPRCLRVIDSWRGLRPVLHYSVSREDVLVNHSPDIMPDHKKLLAEGHNKQKIRAHSEFFWNNPVNDWALTFLENFDIMCESKAKNLASFKLHERYKVKYGYV